MSAAADADIAAADDGEVGEGDTIIADVERIVGGKGNDVLGGITINREFLGFEQGSQLVGMTLEGRAGNDLLRGMRTQDAIVGGFGDDRMKGARRGDTLKGGPGGRRPDRRPGPRHSSGGGWRGSPPCP